MVFTDRRRRVVPARAVRRPVNPALARVLTLGGLVAAGWLLGGTGAALADTVPAERDADRPVVAVDFQRITEDTSDTVDLSRVGGALDESTRDLSGSSLSETATGAGEAARHTVVHTTSSANGLVSETLETGEKVGAYADSSLISGEGALAENLSEGLSVPAGEIRDGLQQVVKDGPKHRPLPDLDIPGIPALSATPSTPEHSGGAPDRDEAGTRTGKETPATRGKRGPDAPSGAAERYGAGALINTEAVTASRDLAGDVLSANEDDSSANPVTPFEKPWRPGSDSTGAVSSSSAPSPAAAGFLVHRADSLRLVAERVALPGDPTLVVRDATDDPSYSPD